MTYESAGEPTRIVVVGSGFAGFECARSLTRRLRGTDARVIMISPRDYMLYTPLLPEVAGGILDARFVTIPLSEALSDVELVTGRVDAVDFDARTVHVTDCEQGVEEVAWDRVVLTPGSVTRLFDVPGLAEHARGLKSPAEALYFRDQLLTQIELAERDTDPGSPTPDGRSSWSVRPTRARNSRPNSAPWPTKQRPVATSTPRRSGSCCSTPPTR